MRIMVELPDDYDRLGIAHRKNSRESAYMAARQKPMTCGTCRHWEPDYGGEPMGFCRGLETNDGYAYPLMKADEFCSSWEVGCDGRHR